ncbi:hypothetical protein QBK99_11220 [Corticibacterium sp. UT-5YL-CI-8]|nr:hypothetical protein [Tianweitania sp. UT-5YL-CI-8]
MSTHTPQRLALLQAAGTQVEKMMLEHLIDYPPCEKLLVGDVIQIARHARQLSFDLFSAIDGAALSKAGEA